MLKEASSMDDVDFVLGMSDNEEGLSVVKWNRS
jgi:hypothetical protein